MAWPQWKPPLATQTVLFFWTLIALIYESWNNIGSNIPHIILQKHLFQTDLKQLCLFNTHNEMLKLLFLALGVKRSLRFCVESKTIYSSRARPPILAQWIKGLTFVKLNKSSRILAKIVFKIIKLKLFEII